MIPLSGEEHSKMFTSNRKFRMNRVLQGCVLVCLLFVPSVWWIYSRCLNVMMQDDEWEKWTQVEEEIRAKIEEDKMLKFERVTNDIEGIETYPKDNRRVPASIKRKRKDGLRQRYENDPKYVKGLKEIIQSKETEKDKGSNLETISNDIEENETFPMDIRYIPASIRRKHEKDIPQAFGDEKYLQELKEMLQAKWDPDKVPLLHLKKVMFIIYMQALLNPVTQASGLNLIFDLKNARFKYVKYSTPQNLFLLHHVSFEALPAKYLGYHLVNLNTIGNFLVTVIRPFLPKFIESIFYTHSSVKDLHDYFPTSMLPVQYGGDLVDYYPAEWIRNANKQHGKFPAGGQKNTF